MSDVARDDRDVPCIELVELLSAYLDDVLPDAERVRVVAHLAQCDGCTAALEQFRSVIELGKRLNAADAVGDDALTRDALSSTFRWLRRR